MKFLNRLIPPFLRRLDLYLLQHYPIIWETKIAYVLFYALSACLTLCSVGLLVPVSRAYVPKYSSFLFSSFSWTGILIFLALGYYAYQQSFIRIKTYTLRENLLRYGLYVMAVLAISSNLLVLPYTVISRVRSLYTLEEIRQDKITMKQASILADLTKKMWQHPLDEMASQKRADIFKKATLNRHGNTDKLIQAIETI